MASEKQICSACNGERIKRYSGGMRLSCDLCRGDGYLINGAWDCRFRTHEEYAKLRHLLTFGELEDKANGY